MLNQVKRKAKGGLVSFVSRLPRNIQNEIVRAMGDKSTGDLRWFDYPLSLKCRWSDKNPNLPILSKILQNESHYTEILKSFVPHLSALSKIPIRSEDSTSPSWVNGWISALDATAIYSFIANREPKHYWEVGSGSSTKFARQAINREKLRSKIISIDPHPRKEIDGLCDEVMRCRFEELPEGFFSRAQKNDVIFIDNSHVALMNSDVTVFFLEVLPNLPPGVIIGIHDIFWPFDYPDNWADRLYSEQYLLGSMLLGGNRLEIDLPAYYLWVRNSGLVSRVLAPLYDGFPPEVQKHGGAFWFTWKG